MVIFDLDGISRVLDLRGNTEFGVSAAGKTYPATPMSCGSPSCPYGNRPIGPTRALTAAGDPVSQMVWRDVFWLKEDEFRQKICFVAKLGFNRTIPL